VNGQPKSPRGRGAADNPPSRFEALSLERDPDWNPAEDPALATRFLRDHSQTVITYNDSPDIPFAAGGITAAESRCSENAPDNRGRRD
jgi:hypothetical protein